MSPRLIVTTKLVWGFLVLITGPPWSPIQCAAVKVPPKTPSTIEAQAKFFQDFFSVQLSPYKIEFGHVCEDPNTWEQRYEKKDYKNHRDMGKVRWGDKKGGYGEHYWDLNHAGHSNNHGDDNYNDHSDDGSYHHDDNSDNGYEGATDHSPSYGDDYDPEKASFEESGRAKRAQPKIKQERRAQKEHNHEDPKPKGRKNKEQLQEPPPPKEEENQYSDEDESSEEVYQKPKRPRYRQPYEEKEDRPQKETKKQVVLVVKENDGNQEDNSRQKYQDFSQFVPYDGGAGVRQHHQPETTIAASVPRLFLEPTTGHVIDRATGQAYVLQPIAAPNNYN